MKASGSFTAFTYLSLFGLAITIPLLVIFGALLFQSAQTQRTQLEDRVVQVLDGLVNEIDRDLDRDITILNTLATSRTLANADWPAFYNEATAGLQGRAYLVLVDTDGRQLVNTYVPYGQQPAMTGDPETIRRILQTKAPVISNLFVSLVVKRPVFNVSIPVLQGGQVRYVMSLGLFPDDLVPLLASQMDADWVATIWDANGVILARSRDNARHIGKSLTQNRRDIHQGAVIRTANLDGADVLHATARSRVSGWGVSVNIPYPLLTTPLRNSLLAWGVAAGLALAIALALGSLFARPMTTSLSVATNAAAAFGRGEPSAFTGSSLKETDTLLATLRDAHQAREKLTEEVTQNREWLRVTLSSIGDAVIATDIDGTITFLNHVAESLTGWIARDAVGQPLHEVFRIINEETRLPVDNPALRAIQQGVAGGLANHTVLVTKDGTERPIADAGAPIRNAAGTIIGSVLIFRDVSEQRKAQKAIEQSLNTFFNLVERSPFGIYVVDASFHISHMNAHAQTRAFQNVRPVIGRDFTEAMRILWPEPVALEIISNFRKTLDTGEPFYSPRFVNPRRDIEAVEGYEWELQRITLPNGQFGVICYYYDSTALRQAEDEARESARRATQAEQKLKEADHRKDEFLATLAHELRNPLAPIRVALEFLHRADGDRALIDRARNVMDRQVSQMVRLVDDLLDVSRISSGKLQLRKERIELAGVVQTAIETARPLIDASAHELSVSMPAEAIRLDADPARLAQVVANLLNNAAKYTEKGGHIWLTVDRRGDRVVLSVRDTGIGIPADQLRDIFQMFAQATPAVERSQGGLGIGLALVKGLVELHDGTVEARSGGPGKGSEFSIELPIAAALTLASEEPEPATGEDKLRAVGKRRVLVVDDLQDAADSWAMMLQMMGHETRTASDGVEAVQAAAAFRPHIVLLDIGLPKMNGYEVARRIRSESWGADVVLVALTGWGQAEDKRRSLEAGFNQHLTKPIDPAALQDLLASAPVTGLTDSNTTF